MLTRIFPKQVDNTHRGHPAALWLLLVFILLKFTMSTNTMLNTRSVATGGDGIALETMTAEGAQVTLMLFALLALGQFVLALQAAVVLVRYRALIPLMYLLLLLEVIARRVLVTIHAVPRSDGTPVGFYINIGLLILVAVGFALSLTRRERGRQ
ncbi:MAG: hypothetical protein WD771_11245 [Gemmatimonadaceae bacterium]